jgi:hypothetical protein
MNRDETRGRGVQRGHRRADEVEEGMRRVGEGRRG